MSTYRYLYLDASLPTSAKTSHYSAVHVRGHTWQSSLAKLTTKLQAMLKTSSWDQIHSSAIRPSERQIYVYSLGEAGLRSGYRYSYTADFNRKKHDELFSHKTTLNLRRPIAFSP